MKAILKFNLDDPEDDMSYQRAVRALELTLALWTISQQISDFNKWLDSKHELISSQDVRMRLDRMSQIPLDYDINLDNLIS